MEHTCINTDIKHLTLTFQSVTASCSHLLHTHTHTNTRITGGTLSGQDYPNVLFPDKWINATFSFDFFAEAETLYRGAT